ncbi:hypothetical protein SB6408_04575 [Klebsiella spallanzanii]|uniref:Uncharacterized protein n=1 Tax=Klebsiella spallanzanii TaxID=2587528 RepID=A0A564JCN1_9ENTR|nr:hypothetical protein SB6408_04575 [Klebsiella spallanzanii]
MSGLSPASLYLPDLKGRGFPRKDLVRKNGTTDGRTAMVYC